MITLQISLFIFGIIIGSFLNVLIYRIPEKITMQGRSMCPKCKTLIRWYHNIPIFSWIFLKGKCRYCNNKIHYQYPLIEFISGILILIVAYKFNYDVKNIYLWSTYLILIGLLVLSAIDFKYKAVPDVISIPLIFFSIFNLTRNYDIIQSFNMVLIILGGVLLFKYTIELLFNKEMLGEADIIISSIMIGILQNFSLFYLAIYISAMIILILYIIQKLLKKNERDLQIALIPYLLMGTIVSYTEGLKLLSLIYK